jgi:Tfp pilus assembly protein PilO
MSIDIDIKKVLKEHQTEVLITAAILIASIIYIIIFAPVAGKMRLEYEKCRACETQVAEAHNLIEMGHKIDKEYGSRVLISEQEAAVGIEEFTRHGKSLGINFISIKPLNVVKDENALYKILPVELLIEASAEQFLKFIGSIDELEKAIVAIKSFDITPDKNDRKKLKIGMVVNVYLSLQEGGPGEA